MTFCWRFDFQPVAIGAFCDKSSIHCRTLKDGVRRSHPKLNLFGLWLIIRDLMMKASISGSVSSYVAVLSPVETWKARSSGLHGLTCILSVDCSVDVEHSSAGSSFTFTSHQAR